MIKKIISLLWIFSCCILFVGCEEVQELTDEETKLVAECAADLLLKHDLSYEDRIAQGEQDSSELTTTEVEDDISSEENNTQATTTQEKEENTTEDLTEDVKEDSDETIVKNENDIAKIVGIKDASILYKDFKIMKQYPAKDVDGAIVNISASDGYQLLILKFGIRNITQEPIQVSLMDHEVKYDVICNDKYAANPMLTILLDDLETLDIHVNPDKEEEAVLIFQISEDLTDKLETIDLKMHYHDEDYLMHILDK